MKHRLHQPLRVTHDYDDILHFPHPIPAHLPPLSRTSRAAQFAPFAALTGHDEAIYEAARQTIPRPDPDETVLQELDRRLAALRTRLTEHPQVQLTYFVPDAHKAGGALHTVIGTVHRLDDINGLILLQDGTQIPLGDVTAITFPDPLQIDF